ncbi:unnamed protein product [Owenia fusiformis]|uniref:Uncharacterized protein n=1 Tax=Owenia fusiformis TaxID=6347 RepID=A0A8J1UKQ0_OWEFU|nr:unnamed protein product [Owenia fusiformis]
MTMKYMPSGENLTHVFTWGMRTVSYMTQQYPSVSSIRSTVVMRGHVFAVQNEFFQKIGGYDPTIELGGGENLELSFRTWMCGGNIKVVPCSRVGILALNHPLEITNGNNIKRIVELWMGDRRGLVLRDKPDADIVKSVQARKSSLETLKCHDFSWFLNEVAPFLETPKHIPNQFGTLYVKSGYCARRSSDNNLQLGECRKNEYSPNSVFHLHTNGKLLCGGNCLTLTHSRFITVQPCREGDDKRQHWKYEDTGEITTKDPHKEGDKLCMMHVTDPDTANHGRQILMVQHCHIGANHDFQKFVFNVF